MPPAIDWYALRRARCGVPRLVQSRSYYALFLHPPTTRPSLLLLPPPSPPPSPSASQSPSTSPSTRFTPPITRSASHAFSTTPRRPAQRQRRLPARMQLSATVARGPVAAGRNAEPLVRYGAARPPPRRMAGSPFGGMNQTVPPDLTRRPNRNARSQAQEKRSQTRAAVATSTTRGHPPSKSAPAKKERSSGSTSSDSPLFKALKMQAVLTPVHYEKRSQIKHRIEGITSFDEFRGLLPVVQEAIRDNLFAGFKEITPTPIQRLAIPALLDETPLPA
ncbi:RNA helicase, partial [Ascosphaera acerosa]